MTKQSSGINPVLFFGGLAIGAILTALYTPKNGKEMRSHLKYNAGKASSDLKAKTANIKEKTYSAKEKVKDKLQKSQNDEPPLPPAAM